MRNCVVIAAALALVATGAMAQTPMTQTPPAQNGPQNSVVNTPSASNRQVAAPVKGHNSFTRGEAKSRIEKMGYSQVAGLTKDRDGVWRGRAVKDGRHVAVGLDYEGNVVEGNGSQGSAGR